MAGEELTRGELAEALRAMGLRRGDSLIVHSSYRSVAPVNGGPATVVDALLDVIGPDGNLMLPTFNYSRPPPEPYYDPRGTPCRTGIIAELGRQRPEAARSLHPTHSVAVIGPQAEEMTREHLAVRAFGVGSPIDRLASAGGCVLLLGVGHVANSAVHVAEEHAGIPKAFACDEPPVVKVRLPDGRMAAHRLDSSPSCSAAFGAVELILRDQGRITDARIHGAKVQLMRAGDVIALVSARLRERPDLLLCTWPECKPCTGTRRNLERYRQGEGSAAQASGDGI